MRLGSAIGAVTCAFGVAVAWGADSFPYTGYVNTDGVAVRADPSGRLGATMVLSRGAPVEVYRHDPGGWFAIRPPEGSFSWIQARYLKMTDQPGVAEVTADGACAWIGAAGNDQRLAWQVRLDPGEHVRVLESKGLVTDSDAVVQPWLKIAPPSGEFRWIHGRYVDRNPPGPPAAEQDEPAPPGKSTQTAPADETAADPATGGASPKTGIRLVEWTRRQAAAASDRPADVGIAPRSGATGAESSTANIAGTADGDDQVDAVDLELSVMVAREPDTWRLPSLRRRAEALAGAGATAIQRDRARRLLARIKQFEDIRRRRDEIAAARLQSEASRRIGAAAAVGAPSDKTGPRFDGTGWLMPLVSQPHDPRLGGRSLPAYALTDDYGNILQLVSPTPGMNLTPYVRRQIGIYGARDYIPELKTPHLTARRIVALDRHRR